MPDGDRKLRNTLCESKQQQATAGMRYAEMRQGMGPGCCLASLLLLLLSRFSHVRLCGTPQTAAHRPWDFPGRVLEWAAIAFSGLASLAVLRCLVRTKSYFKDLLQSQRTTWGCSVLSYPLGQGGAHGNATLWHIPLKTYEGLLERFGASQVVPGVKNPSASAGDIRDVGSMKLFHQSQIKIFTCNCLYVAQTYFQSFRTRPFCILTKITPSIWKLQIRQTRGHEDP